MPKILLDADYESLHERANNYDAVVASIVSAQPGINASDVTLQVITEALIPKPVQEQQDSSCEDEEARLRAENKSLQEQVCALLQAPASKPATIISDGEPAGELEQLSAFADKNAGNTAAILERCLKDGLITEKK